MINSFQHLFCTTRTHSFPGTEEVSDILSLLASEFRSLLASLY